MNDDKRITLSPWAAQIMDVSDGQVSNLDYADNVEELSWYDQQLRQNHRREVAAELSATIRTSNVGRNREALGHQFDASLMRTHAEARAMAAGMDPNNPIDAPLIDYAVNRVAATRDDYLGMLQAYTQTGMNRAGTDIRKGIGPEPPLPPPPPPAPVIRYTTGPKMRPAQGLRDLGKAKWVRVEDDE